MDATLSAIIIALVNLYQANEQFKQIIEQQRLRIAELEAANVKTTDPE